MYYNKYWMSDFVWWLFCLPNKPQHLSLKRWDDFYDEAKTKYPISFCLGYTIPLKISIVWKKIANISYWIRTHTYNRYYIIDVRQPKNSPGQYAYGWGFIDSSRALVLANFKILTDFVEKEFLTQYWWINDDKGKWRQAKKSERKTWEQLFEEYSKDIDKDNEEFELSDGSFDEAAYSYRVWERQCDRELLMIYKWWKIDRFELCKKEDEILKTWFNFTEVMSDSEEDKEKRQFLFDATNKTEKEREDKEEDMLIRLVKIRGRLST